MANSIHIKRLALQAMPEKLDEKALSHSATAIVHAVFGVEDQWKISGRCGNSAH